jgi:hypothetical protein
MCLLAHVARVHMLVHLHLICDLHATVTSFLGLHGVDELALLAGLLYACGEMAERVPAPVLSSACGPSGRGDAEPRDASASVRSDEDELAALGPEFISSVSTAT